MLSLDDFTQISLDDKPVFDSLHSRFPPVHSGEVFTTMVSWGHYVDYRYVAWEDSLVISSKDANNLLLHYPLGKPNADIVNQIMKLAVREDAVFGFIKNNEKKCLMSQLPHLVFVEDRDFFDYVYRVSDLANLPGTAYGKIRNRLHKFLHNTTYTVEDISIKNMDEIHEFLKRWCLWRDCASDELLDNERKAILFSMSHFFELGLQGLAVRIKGALEAIAVFEQMNKDTVVVHFEKGSPEYDGIYKAINMETAKRVSSRAVFIDREEDLGVPGLRKAKLSYHPDHFIELFHVTKESLRASLT